MKPALKQTPDKTMPRISNQVSLGGAWKSSHPIKCKIGIGIQNRVNVVRPMRDVIKFEYSKNVVADAF